MNHDEARAQFPVLARYAYLNAGTFGPLARPVYDAMRAEHDAALTEGRASPPLFERMMGLRARVREKLAAAVGASAAHVALTSSTTNGCHVVLNGLDLGDGDEIVTTDSEHFGLIGPLTVSGARLKAAKLRDRPAAEAFDAILAEITPRTRLIALSHVTWVNGHVIPFAELREAAGVPVLVDGAQSVGAVRVDASGADFYTISGQKWLCGPDLCGGLFIKEPDALRVSLPAWLPGGSSDIATARWEPTEGIERFDSHFTPLATLAGLEAALDLRPEWGFERAAEMTARCREILAEHADVVTEPRQGTLVSFRAGDGAHDLAVALYDRGVIVRDIPGTGLVRVSCGWWTSDDDLARLAAGVAAA